MKLVELPSCSSASAIVFIGRNKRGHWVAQEQNGLYGGLFVNPPKPSNMRCSKTVITPKQSSS